MTWLASIISHSKSVSFTRASRIFSHIPLSRHRQNRRCTFFQFPYISGKSRHGAPVRRIQNTPLINCRVSRAFPPRVPFSPIVYGRIFSHAPSLISCRSCSLAICCVRRFKRCSLTADDGAWPPLEWCTASGEMVHGGRGRGARGRHVQNHSGMPLRLRMDSPSIWMV